MESQQLPLIDHETWESLCCLCPEESHQATLIEYLQALTPEWHNYFSSFYSEGVVSVSARSSLTTGLLKVNSEQYHYGAVLKVVIRDPWRYYTAMTRFIIVYLDANLTVSTIARSSIEPAFDDEFVQPGQVKK
jgi:hypothetical protein